MFCNKMAQFYMIATKMSLFKNVCFTESETERRRERDPVRDSLWLSLSLYCLLGSQGPCSTRSGAIALQHFILVWRRYKCQCHNTIFTTYHNHAIINFTLVVPRVHISLDMLQKSSHKLVMALGEFGKVVLILVL